MVPLYLLRHLSAIEGMSISQVLVIPIEEANISAGETPHFLRLSADPEEALRKYRALAAVMMSQLEGLRDCHLRFVVSPADAVEAVAFWLLPLLRGEVKKVGEDYLFTPEKHAPAITLDFLTDEGDLRQYAKHARLNLFCLSCGSRWVNMALTQCAPARQVVGAGYLRICHRDSVQDSASIDLPCLDIVDSEIGWEEALRSPLGGKLKKFYTAEV